MRTAIDPEIPHALPPFRTLVRLAVLILLAGCSVEQPSSPRVRESLKTWTFGCQARQGVWVDQDPTATRFPVQGSLIRLTPQNEFSRTLFGLALCSGSSDTAEYLNSSPVRWDQSASQLTFDWSTAVDTAVRSAKLARGYRLRGRAFGTQARLFVAGQDAGPWSATNANYVYVDVRTDGPKTATWSAQPTYALQFGGTMTLPATTVQGFWGDVLTGAAAGARTIVLGTPGVVTVDAARQVEAVGCGTTTVVERFQATTPMGTSTSATTASTTITVSNCPAPPVVATIEGPTVVGHETTCTWTAVNVSGGVPPYRYRWVWDDSWYGDGPSVTWSHFDLETFNVQLQVTDAQSRTFYFYKAVSMNPNATACS